MKDDIQLNTLELFCLRYALDEPDPVENLKQDIVDLQYFPERLEQSYRALWVSYVKRKLRTDSRNEEKLTELLANTKLHEDAQFLELRDIIEQTQQLNVSQNISAIKSPLKRYVEQLLLAQ